MLPDQRRADDAGVIAQPGRDNPGARLDVLEPLRGLLAYAATHDDQIRRKKPLHHRQVDVYALRPIGPREVESLSDRRRRETLERLAPPRHMAELGVGEQPSAVEQRRANARAKSQHQHRAQVSLARPEFHFREPGGICVIDQLRRAPRRAAEKRHAVLLFPIAAEVADNVDPVAENDARKTHAHRPVPFEMPRDRARRGETLGRRARGINLHAVPFAEQPARLGVHGRALEGGPTDIDAEDNHD